MYKVKVFQNKESLSWNKFVSESKNGTFLFNRSYMDYHRDRFVDCSLMVYEDKKLIALLPANRVGNELITHQGLTYGGIICGENVKVERMLEIFNAVLDFLKSIGVSILIYKTIPHIYHKIPSEEDLYALFVHNAKLYRRDVCTVIKLQNHDPIFERRRLRGVKKAINSRLRIEKNQEIEEFMGIVSSFLENNFEKKPVHSSEELIKLMHDFPENIKFFGCYNDNKMVSGAIIYVTDTVAHAQYVFSSEEGKFLGANDFMYHFLVYEEFKEKEFFDFGISNEKDGYYLNKGLVSQKESFGGRAICHDFYKVIL
ncbi:MAG: GNAT family N-acetyltransferase [Alphaproteobacteria bacterium]|nr:GNAT family N-acetyltransferase [Alphaproteobacteria bacterium]